MEILTNERTKNPKQHKLLQTKKASSLAKYIKKYFGRLQKMVSKSLLVPTDHKATHRCQPVYPLKACAWWLVRSL